MRFRFLIGVALWVMLAACSTQPDSDAMILKPVTLPNGQTVQAEVMMRPQDMMRGMMFRPQLPAGRGLLFVHVKPGKFSYWMHNVNVPLDIIWMDTEHTIVEISPNTPPCPEKDPVKCPQFGGSVESQFVLELGGGEAAKYGLKVGDRLSF